MVRGNGLIKFSPNPCKLVKYWPTFVNLERASLPKCLLCTRPEAGKGWTMMSFGSCEFLCRRSKKWSRTNRVERAGNLFRSSVRSGGKWRKIENCEKVSSGEQKTCELFVRKYSSILLRRFSQFSTDCGQFSLRKKNIENLWHISEYRA